MTGPGLARAGAIRPWREEDIPRIAALVRELDEALGGDFRPDEGRLRAMFGRMAALPGIYETYVYEEEGEVLGFVSLLFYESAYHRVGTAQVNELVVDARRRSGGVGAALLARAVARARARGMDEIEVGVERENEGARRFYARHGISEEYLLLGMEL